MQTTIKNRRRLPDGARQSHISLAPQTGDFMGSTVARVVGFLTIEESLERVIATSISLTPDEARDLAARLIAAADTADAMLAAMPK